MSAKTKAVGSGYGWVILVVTFFAGFTAPANMAKVTALAPVIMQEFGLNPTTLGLTISMFYLLGVICAPLAGFFIKKTGIRGAISIAVGAGVVGSALGLLSTNLGLFLVSRIFEGAGMGLLGVAGASAIAPWFPPEKRGLPLGLWAMWVALAMFVCPLIYGQMVGTAGMSYKAVWWVTLIFDVAMLVIFNLVYRKPDVAEEDSLEAGKLEIGRVLKGNPTLVILALIFLFDECAFMAVNGFVTTYLTEVLSAPLATATFFASYMAVMGTVMAPIGGKVSDLLKSKKKVLIIGICCGIIMCATIFQVANINMYYFLMIIGGVAGGCVPAVIWAATPDTVAPKDVPTANTCVAFTQNLGMLIGAMAMGGAITGWGWSIGSWAVLVPCYIVCLFLAILGLKKLK